MMINIVKNHDLLSNFVKDECNENGICISFDENISKNSYVIIKVDDYYNSLNIQNRPASVDCMIIRECVNNLRYGLTLVELKNIDSGKGFDIKNMREKFETTLFDFIKNKFREPLDIDYSDVKLIFVSNQEIYKRDLGLKMEVLINLRFKFNDKNLMITPKMPTPAIKNCY